MTDTVRVASEGLMLDAILAKIFGPVTTREARLVEATLALNPGLAESVDVPIGTAILLPARPEGAVSALEAIVDLFATVP